MRKRKYVKISVDMFENRKLKLIENMENRDMIEIIWMRLLIEATKTNDSGLIYLEKDIPYTTQMLSIVLGRDEEEINLALKVLIDLKMIEVNENNFIKVCSWSDHNKSKRKSNTDNTNKNNEKTEEVSLKTKISSVSDIKNKSVKSGKRNISKKKKIDVILFNNEEMDEKTDIIEFHDEEYSPPGKIIETFTFT